MATKQAEKKKRMTTAEMLDAMVAPIVESLEAAIADAEAGKPVTGWLRPWRVAGGSAFGRSVSLKNPKQIGRPYTGWNAVLTAFVAAQNGWDAPLWGTFKQWAAIGGSVRKGERGMSILHPIFRKKTETAKDGTETERSILTGFRSMNVFNLAQIRFLDKSKTDGTEIAPEQALPESLAKFLPKPDATLPEFNPIEAAEAVARMYADKPSIAHGGDAAYYRPSTDAIQMPKPEAFDAPESYYQTLFHEMAHSTGHESRLNRLLPGFRFGDHGYSVEELCAEMAAEMLSGHCGIQTENTSRNAIAYLRGWMQRLKDDPSIIYHAGTAAVKAAQWVLGDRAELKPQRKPGIAGEVKAEAA